MNKLCFVYLLQPGERNFYHGIHTTWEEPFSAALYGQCGGGKLMAELHYAAGQQLYNFIEGVELSSIAQC